MPENQLADIEGLRRFKVIDDRVLTPFFVGRTEVISEIEQNCRYRFENWCSLKPWAMDGATRLIQGAPGAGKSATLRFLAERWRKGQSAPIAVPVGNRILADLPQLLATIANAIAPGSGDSLVADSTLAQRGTIGPSAVSYSREKSTAVRASRLGWPDLHKAVGPSAWKRPVCLLVDEIQTVTSGAAETLMELHKGEHELPVIAVLAGLANSRERLRKAGLSRLSSGGVHTLGPLDLNEAAAAARKFLNEFRIAGRTELGHDFEQMVAADSLGWPQHLHNGLRALAEELIEAGGNLAAVDQSAVLKRSNERHREYYNARYTPEMSNSEYLLAKALGKIGEHRIRRLELVDAVQRHHANGRRAGERLPEGVSAARYVDHMIEVGVLHDDNGFVKCPIPSLQQHIVERGQGFRVETPERDVQRDWSPTPSPFD